jgi:hypothetical protein
MPMRRVATYTVGVLVSLIAGCAYVSDVSEKWPYPPYIGNLDKLSCDCELRKHGQHPATFVILVPEAPQSTGENQPVYATLPRGTIVTIDAVQQELDKNGHPYDYAVVTLDDPKHPTSRIQAGVCFQFLESLSQLRK